MPGVTLYRYRATLTVFFAMSMMMFMSMVFSVLELVHVKLLYLQRDIVASAAIESAFADYNRMLWDDYGILALDSGYGSSAPQLPIVESRMEEYASVAAAQPGLKAKRLTVQKANSQSRNSTCLRLKPTTLNIQCSSLAYLVSQKNVPSAFRQMEHL